MLIIVQFRNYVKDFLGYECISPVVSENSIGLMPPSCDST
jgi:hypothetical protein